jgi:hypothetical protein
MTVGSIPERGSDIYVYRIVSRPGIWPTQLLIQQVRKVSDSGFKLNSPGGRRNFVIRIAVSHTHNFITEKGAIFP